MDHFISIDQVSDINDLVGFFEQVVKLKAEEYHTDIESCGIADLSSKVLTNLFYEPSTRTSSSFAAAMYRLGGNVISINDVSYSSIAKGEDLEDTIRTLGAYSDLIVLRSRHEGDAERAADVSFVPVINAGDGAGEHPTQALLDMYTVFSATEDLDVRVTFLGDLKYGRTVHSLVKLLRLVGAKINFVSPKQLMVPNEYVSASDRIETDICKLDLILKETDVLYVTRLQKERLSLYEHPDWDFCITNREANLMPESSIILHPFPRVNEIAKEVDNNPRAWYFEQIRNGLFVRMALINNILVFGRWCF